MNRQRGWWMYLLGPAAAIVVVWVVLVRFGPAATLSLSLALPGTERSLAAVLPEPVREEVVLVGTGRNISADLYRPARPRAALVLVHGLSRAGRRHPELIRLARLLARHGEAVLVPEFAGLVAFRLSGSEVAEIRTALRYLTRTTDAVGVVGFSFGAGPALLAAAEFPHLRLAASFGGYADLERVIRYVTTGVHTFGGRRYAQPQEEYNRWKLLMLLVGFVESQHDRARLGALAERKLENPSTDVRALTSELGREGQAVLELVMNRQEAALPRLLAELSPHVRQALASLSPLGVARQLRGRVLIAHGAADESIPFTESLRLAEAIGGRAQLAILQTFHHTGAQPLWRSLLARSEDAWNLLRLADGLLLMDEAGGAR